MSWTQSTVVWALLGVLLLIPSCFGASSSPPASQTACKSVDPICMADLNQNAQVLASKPWDDIVSAVLNCAGMSSSDVVTRILLPEYSTPGWDESAWLMSYFSTVVKQLTGIVFHADFVAPSQLAGRVLDEAETGRGYYSSWMARPALIPDLLAQNRVVALDNLVLTDQTLDWLDVHKSVRSQLVYNGSVAGLPNSFANMLMYYRSDYLSAAKLPVPATWDDLVMVAQALNGTDFNMDGRPDYAMCLMIAGDYCDGRDAAYIIGTILASYTQVRGLSTGWMIDPDTISSFVDTEAMRKTLNILAQLTAMSWPSTSCSNMSPDYWAGRCAITITHDGTFTSIQKRNAPNPLKGSGKVGLAAVPGSHEVLDRATGKLVECDTTAACPYATPQYSLTANKTVLVNNAPVNVPTAIMMMNRDAPPAFKTLSTKVMAVMSRPEQAIFGIFASELMGSPYRYKQLATNRKGLAIWQGYGCNTTENKDYLTTVSGILDHPNLASSDLRVLSGYKFRNYLQDAAFMVASRTPTTAVHTWLSQQFAVTLNSIPKRQFAESLWLGLNIQRRWQETSPPPAAPGSIINALLAPNNSKHLGTVLAVALPCTAVLMLLVCAGFWAFKKGWLRRGPSGPPTAGPRSTLVVTDVEDSTVLWETLPMNVMDHAIRLHHTLIRALLSVYHGYESATEGDSFIMAFHSAGDALAFAFSLQQQLMEQLWPAELLDHKPTAFVGVVRQMVSKAKPPQQVTCATHPRESAGIPVPPSSPGRSSRVSLFLRDSSSEAHASPRLQLHIEQRMGSATSMPATVMEALKAQWAVEDSVAEIAGSPMPQVAYRGIRLRLGLHSGINDTDIVANKTIGGVQYTGHALTVAKAVADSGQGGMVLMTLAAFEAIKHEWLPGKEEAGHWQRLLPAVSSVSHSTTHPSPLIMHMGSYSFLKAPDLQACEVYLAVPAGHECRLGVGRLKLRNATQLAAGVLQAPVGQASVVFCTMVGYRTLVAWNKDVATLALAMYNNTATRLLAEEGDEGHYLLEMADGLCLCVFSSASSAILWGLQVVDTMKQLEWPDELLAHELCESVMVTVTAGHQQADSTVGVTTLFHGPRVKVGVDFGDVTCDVSPATARLAYRGRPMNRAARVMDKVPSGQVWCTEAAWEEASKSFAEGLICGRDMGAFPMKGLSQALKLYNCGYVPEGLGWEWTSHKQLTSGVQLESLTELSVGLPTIVSGCRSTPNKLHRRASHFLIPFGVRSTSSPQADLRRMQFPSVAPSREPEAVVAISDVLKQAFLDTA